MGESSKWSDAVSSRQVFWPRTNICVRPILTCTLCAGWTSSFSSSIATKQPPLTCQLCPAGYYDSAASLSLPAACLPCPLNTYNPTLSAIGGCTPCPPQQTTLKMGSTSLDNCTCPSPMIKIAGTGCIGCAGNQYLVVATGKCMQCPSDSLAQAGASSLADCLCMPGFYYHSNDDGCQACPSGSYSSYASNAPSCTPCPKGSTTAGIQTTSITACGASSSLCLKGYTWRLGVGCFLSL